MKFLRFAGAACALTALLFSSCKKDNDNTVAPENQVSDYYPVNLGHYVEYNVDSTYWDDFLALKTVKKMQMRYTVVDTFTDLARNPSYRVEVLVRKNDTSQWQPESVFSVTKKPSSVEVVQNNLRFIKLQFPVTNGNSWQGNQYISTFDQELQYFRDWTYKFSDVGKPYDADGVVFQNTATVNQIDETVNDPELQPEAYATRNFGKEIYGKGAGLLYREAIHWVYDPGVGVRKARKGYGVRMSAYKHN